jgi:hypothetical protein
MSVVFAVTGGTMRAESIGYPETEPAFTIEIPDGWETMFDNRALKIGGPADALVMFQRVTDVKDDAAAKKGLPTLVEQAGKTFSMTDVAVTAAPAAAEVGKFKGMTSTYKGTDADGEDAVWSVTIFPATKGDYYLMTVVHPKKTAAESAAGRAALQASLTPAK